MARSGFLERLGIVRHTMKRDLLLFFLPWFALFILELRFCGTHGEGLSGFWGVIWGVITHPHRLFAMPAHRAVGLSLFVLGLTTMIVGQATLWRNYSGFVVIKRGHQLVTHGIYRFTRNPIYLGLIVVLAGLPVYCASLYGFLVMLATIPVLRFRISLEETLLGAHFGDEYEAYRTAAKRLIPFLY